MVGVATPTQWSRRASQLALVTVLAATMTACGGGASSESGAANPADQKNAASTASPKGPEQPSVPTAKEPSDPCAWIPASEVEAIVGKLAAPPKREDGCLYTMVMPESVSARRQQMVEQQEKLQAQLKARFKDYEPPEFHGPIANYERDPKT